MPHATEELSPTMVALSKMESPRPRPLNQSGVKRPLFVKWITGTGLAVVDQGIVSGVNVIALVIVGRFCGESALGVYSLAAAVMLMLTSAVEALITSPYVLNMSRMKYRLRHYTGSMLLHSVLFSAIFSSFLFLCLSGMEVANSGSTAAATIWPVCAVTLPLVLREVARRHAFARQRPNEALLLDGLAAVFQIGGLLCLLANQALTATSAVFAAGVASLLAASAYWFLRKQAIRFSFLSAASDLRLNMRMGGWLLGSQATMIAQISSVQWAVALAQGPAQTGRLMAAMSVAMIANPLVTGISNLFLPDAARAVEAEGSVGLSNKLNRLTLILGLGMAFYCLLLSTLGRAALAMLYGARYDHEGLTIILLSLAFSARVIAMPVYIALWVTERIRTNIVLNLVTLGSTAALIWLTRSYGVEGAAASVVASETLGCILRWIAFRRRAHGIAHRPLLTESQSLQRI